MATLHFGSGELIRFKELPTAAQLVSVELPLKEKKKDLNYPFEGRCILFILAHTHTQTHLNKDRRNSPYLI